MWQNPINFLFFVGILFWIPQLQVQRDELQQDHEVLNFMTAHKLTTDEAKTPPMVGPLQIYAKAQPSIPAERCLYSVLEVAENAEALKANKIIVTQPKIANAFNLITATGPIRVASESVVLLKTPEAASLAIQPFIAPTTDLQWEKLWGIKDPATLAWVQNAYVAGGTQMRCMGYENKVLATGYLTAENKMAFTVSSPFTVSFANQDAVLESLYSDVSRSYFGCAFIVMMMGTLGLAILTNSILRGRVNLHFEPVDLSSLPWSSPRTETEDNQAYWIRRLGIQSNTVQHKTFAQLPSFYRYSWDDGLTLKGRKVFFVVHEKGLSFLEMTQNNKVKSSGEVLWSDLFCVYFTQWNSKSSWLDIVTRTGERYQMAVPSAPELKDLLKRWDATQVLDETKAAS